MSNSRARLDFPQCHFSDVYKHVSAAAWTVVTQHQRGERDRSREREREDCFHVTVHRVGEIWDIADKTQISVCERPSKSVQGKIDDYRPPRTDSRARIEMLAGKFPLFLVARELRLTSRFDLLRNARIKFPGGGPTAEKQLFLSILESFA